MKEHITSHGIKFIRSGKCQQCGACGCDDDCAHHALVQGLHWCIIHHERYRPCPVSCPDMDNDGTHFNCIGFPDNPWIRVVRQGICGYSFERADGGSMDDLPFLYGKPYGDHTR